MNGPGQRTAARSERQGQVRLVHLSRYDFATPASQLRVRARLKPRDSGRQRCAFYELTTTPLADAHWTERDEHGNQLDVVAFAQPVGRLEVAATSTVERYPLDAPASPLRWSELVAATRAATRSDPALRAATAELEPAAAPVRRFVEASLCPGAHWQEAVLDLCRQVAQAVRHQPERAGEVPDSPAQILSGGGVCRDRAELALACLRHAGAAARYVAGYLLGREGEGTAEPHAWISVYVPQEGWCDFDPTMGTATSQRHVMVSLGLNHQEASPLSGSLRGGGAQRITVRVSAQAAPARPQPGLRNPP